MDEIPTALREGNKKSKGNKWSIRDQKFGDRTSRNRGMIWLIVALLTLFVVSMGLNIIQNNRASEPVVITEPENGTSSTPQPEQIAPEPEISEQPTEIIDNILGHLAYEEAPLEELRPISADGRIKLRERAAQRYNEMVADAKAQRINLVALSGFRAISEQEYLFFDVKEQRNQVASQRAEVSAPPGYSEHHTGYAVDIGDGYYPDTHLQESFENTPAYQWLKANAPRYSFELSFPRDNLQGISYEPWHWRFVGDTHSLKTFYRARELTTPLE